ncbi:MAG: undecaprenyl-diphosphate phosphatase [Planctomycetaceae bacterium]|nr:undecaprenyl-diphosphate phosphatase [Planctomycetaceae bacterium]
MTYWQAIVLGIVQGVAEFLPISSSGHLVLVEALLNLHSENMAFEIAVHVGTLLSIVVVFRRDLIGLLHLPRVMVAIVVATLPVVFVGLFLKDHLERAFASPLAAGIALCCTAIVLWVTQWFDQGSDDLHDVTLRQAFTVGLFQAVAPIPGISRSGVTIVGGLLSGLNREAAARFSFLIAIPAILGAAVLEGASMIKSSHPIDEPWAVHLVGATVAFMVGVLALHGLLKVVAARKLHAFSWYCLAVGILTVAITTLNNR